MHKRFDFENKTALANGLADALVRGLKNDVALNGVASLAVSGGNTPKEFFAILAKKPDVDWSKIVVTLVDERWVDESSERSNAKLVKQNLLQGPAKNAKFIPLFSGGDIPEAKEVAITNQRLIAELPLPFSAVVLGMGNDGHTASFFPGGDSLHETLNDDGPALVINAPGAGEARITLTLPTLMQTKNLFLHIEGSEKQKTLEQAQADDDVAQMPVRAVLLQQQTPLNIYWCP